MKTFSGMSCLLSVLVLLLTVELNHVTAQTPTSPVMAAPTSAPPVTIAPSSAVDYAKMDVNSLGPAFRLIRDYFKEFRLENFLNTPLPFINKSPNELWRDLDKRNAIDDLLNFVGFGPSVWWTRYGRLNSAEMADALLAFLDSEAAPVSFAPDIPGCEDKNKAVTVDINQTGIFVDLCLSFSLNRSFTLDGHKMFKNTAVPIALKANASSDIAADLKFSAHIESMRLNWTQPKISYGPLIALLNVTCDPTLDARIGVVDLVADADVSLHAMVGLELCDKDASGTYNCVLGDEAQPLGTTVQPSGKFQVKEVLSRGMHIRKELSYSLEADLKLKTELFGFSVPAGANMTIKEDDAFDPNPDIKVNLPRLKDFLELSPENAANLIRIIDRYGAFIAVLWDVIVLVADLSFSFQCPGPSQGNGGLPKQGPIYEKEVR